MRLLRVVVILIFLGLALGTPAAAPAVPDPPKTEEECVAQNGLWIPVVEECWITSCPPRCPGDVLQRSG